MAIKAIVVTRHPALVQYLIEKEFITPDSEVLEHVDADVVKGQHVWGVLPHSLSCLCKSFTEVPMSIPAELRGKELSLENMYEFAGQPVTYVVCTQADQAKWLHEVWYKGYASEWTPGSSWENYAIGE